MNTQVKSNIAYGIFFILVSILMIIVIILTIQYKDKQYEEVGLDLLNRLEECSEGSQKLQDALDDKISANGGNVTYSMTYECDPRK